MKNAKMVKFKNLSQETQDHLIALLHKEGYARRDQVIKMFGIDRANDCWYAKKEYIDNDTYQPDFYFYTCPTCGCTHKDWKCLSDKAGTCQSRNVISKCTCGEIINYSA